MNKHLNVFCALAICVTVISCSRGNLSRDRAADMIRAHPEFKSTFDRKIYVGHIWEDRQGDMYIFAGLQFLVDRGILTVRDTGGRQVDRFYEHLAELTPKGEEAAKAWEKTTEEEQFDSIGFVKSTVTVYRVVIAEKRLIEVTGIAMSEVGTTAQVEFTWKWVPTAYANLSERPPSTELRKCKANFQLFDDGWRIVGSLCP